MSRRISKPSKETAAEQADRMTAEARTGSQAALAELLVADMPQFKRWAHGRVPSSSRGHLDTTDLSQEVALLAVRALTRFRVEHSGSIPAFTRRIGTNRLCDEYRKGRRRPLQVELDENLVDATPSPEAAAVETERASSCRAALQKLRPRDRRLLEARYYEGFDIATIARLLALPSRAAAGMAVRRAEARFRQKLEVSR